jgi:peptidyl-prolyl cis-trans isomerase D
MLTNIREKIIGVWGVVFLVVIGATFVFFGATNFIVGGSVFAAKVDGSEIGIMRFEQTYRDEVTANPDLAAAPEEYRAIIRQQILNGLIFERLIDLHIADDGYQVSDEQLARSIQSIQEFQVDGVFNEEAANTALLSTGMTIGQFRAAQRRQMRINQLQRAIGATAVVTPADYRRYLNLIAEQRLVSLATFDLESVMSEIEVSDETIAAFYDSNDTMFLTEESADVEFIEVRRDAVAESIEVTEEQLLQHYEDNQDRYLQDEQRRSRHILILSGDDEDAAEARADELFARIQAGESFEDLATEFSEDTLTSANGGDLGAMTRSQMIPELAGSVFSISEGDVDGPIQSDFGFHIVKLDGILEQGPLPLDQVRGELLTELRSREAEDAFLALERQVSDVLFDAADMQAIADATGLEIQTASGFTRTGGEPIGSNQAAIDTVFDARILFEGQISEIVELDANRSAVFRVSQHNEASRRPLEEVREDIVGAIRAQEAQTIVFNNAEQLLLALSNGDEFGQAAEAVGATVSAPALVDRRDATVDQAVLAQIFMAKKPGQGTPTRGSVSNSMGGITVFSLDAVLPGQPESIPLADRDAGKLELAGQAGSAEYRAFLQSLYNKADIVISEDALAAQDLFQ